MFKKWLSNQIRALADDTPNILPKRKKKFPATVTWRVGDTLCKSSADVRLTGDLRDHLRLDRRITRPISSLAVRLYDQHINGITRFKLLLPETRKGDNEILATLLFRELGFVAPQTRRVTASVNGSEREYLFQEVAAKELLEHHGLRESLIVEGDERGMWSLISEKRNKHFFWEARWGFGLPDNASWIRTPTAERVALHALSIYSRMYASHIAKLEYGGISQSFFVPDEQVRSANQWIRDESLYVLLSRYLNGQHGLFAHNRKFYFDPIYQQLRPIYYDGNVVPLMWDVELDPRDYRRSDFEKIAVLFSDPVVRARLYKRYSASGGGKPRDAFFELLDALKALNDTNLKAKREMGEQSPRSDVSEHWEIDAHLQRQRITSQRFIGFNTQRSRYEMCTVTSDDVDCVTMPAANAPEYFRDPVTSDDELLLMLGNFSVSNRGVVAFDTGNAMQQRIVNPAPGSTAIAPGDVVWWHFDDSAEAGTFDVTLAFDGVDTGKLIVSGAVPALARFDIRSPQPGAIDFTSRFDDRLLTSCVTFVDAQLTANVIVSKNASCEDGVNFLRAEGSIAELTVTQSAADAIDADFSTLTFGTVAVSDAGNDCIDLSMGHYTIRDFSGIRCVDKGVSVGEQAEATFDRIQITSALSGVVAKDSAIVTVGAFEARDVDYCYQAYRKKQEFDGARIVLAHRDAHVCSGESFAQQGSELVHE